MQYYYSIKDISVGGMCICYGHAQSCPLDPVTKVMAKTFLIVYLYTVYVFTCTPAQVWSALTDDENVCVSRNCSVCVNTIPVVRAVMSVVLVTTSSHGNLEPFLREIHVKVRKCTEKTQQQVCRGYCEVVLTIPICLLSVCLSPLLLFPVCL